MPRLPNPRIACGAATLPPGRTKAPSSSPARTQPSPPGFPAHSRQPTDWSSSGRSGWPRRAAASSARARVVRMPTRRVAIASWRAPPRRPDGARGAAPPRSTSAPRPLVLARRASRRAQPAQARGRARHPLHVRKRRRLSGFRARPHRGRASTRGPPSCAGAPCAAQAAPPPPVREAARGWARAAPRSPSPGWLPPGPQAPGLGCAVTHRAEVLDRQTLAVSRLRELTRQRENLRRAAERRGAICGVEVRTSEHHVVHVAAHPHAFPHCDTRRREPRAETSRLSSRRCPQLPRGDGWPRPDWPTWINCDPRTTAATRPSSRDPFSC